MSYLEVPIDGQVHTFFRGGRLARSGLAPSWNPSRASLRHLEDRNSPKTETRRRVKSLERNERKGDWASKSPYPWGAARLPLCRTFMPCIPRLSSMMKQYASIYINDLAISILYDWLPISSGPRARHRREIPLLDTIDTWNGPSVYGSPSPLVRRWER